MLIAIVPAAPSVCPDGPVGSATTSSTARSEEERGLIASAMGIELLSRQDVEAAIDCLGLAANALPDDPLIARDLAIAHAAEGHASEALSWVDRAIALGDADPEVHELRAMVMADLNRRDDALNETHLSATWESDLIAAALGDERAAYRVADLVNEPTQRGALSALVLAAHAGEYGEQTTARLLTDVAEQNAESSSSPIILNATRALAERFAKKGGISASLRLRSSIDHTTNPAYQGDGAGVRDTGVRLALLGEAAVQIPIGIARVDTAFRVDQHVFLTSREVFRKLDLTGLVLAASIELPISNSPSAALVGFRARFSDAFGDRFTIHYASTFEGGPNLVLPMTARTRLELGIYGVATDYIDVSPANAKISSINRDRIGERATVALSFRADWLEGRGEMMFLRDNAQGDAFNAIGGAAAGRLRANLSGGLILGTGIAVLARQFGPVGDLSIIGPAATRTEIRTVVDLGAQIPIAGGLSFVVGDVWIQNAARAGHAYTENVLSTGMEQIW